MTLTYHAGGDGIDDDCPIEQVRLTVLPTNDPSLPALTFRTWVLGVASCVILSFTNQFFGYRTNQLSISAVSAQIVTLPLGRLMAATLPSRPIQVPFTDWTFSLNPGPFNLKEHVLITIFANSGSSGVYAVHIVTIVKAFYHRSINIIAAFMLSQTTQMLGYGWAGLFRQYLVDSPYMWWPSNLVQVSLFRALHEQEKRSKGGFTRLQFFIVVFISSFAYYLVPGYLFQRIAYLSVVCWIWTKSITAQQLGSGYYGLGLGAFTLDWSTSTSFLGSPLAYPGSSILNILAGFSLIVYVALPILYWSNVYDAKRFPIISSNTFDSSGQTYNISRILNAETFDIDMEAYNGYSKLYLSVFFAIVYGLSFAALASTLSHVALFHGKTIWQMWKKTAGGGHLRDVHTRLMKQNYEAVPQWWFHTILIIVFGLALWVCEGFGKKLQLPWWGLLLACGIALLFTLPIGIITATTNISPGLNVITELVIGFMYPGKPLANVAFKTYGYISMVQALAFLGDFKLGHYMKIPPKSMFLVQLIGTILASSVYFGTAWWLVTSIDHICDPSQLPDGSPWTCPGDHVFYSASIIWGVVGPLRMFGKLGVYSQMNWFFLIGLLVPVPVWYLLRRFPDKKWIQHINMPIIIGSTQGMPPGRVLNYTTWGVVGIFFNFYVYKRFKGWWSRYNYVLSAALDAGVAFMAVILYFAFQSIQVLGPQWWGLADDDQCTLAGCPTAPGVKVEGCPVIG
ncbi:oligopeptide transporter 1-like [Syzygium oleosum]|uniref:oligopeptide transporter 1-like n=1 Tax=Syzygium oleosum TaxID=219896 RepID=UPI0024B89ACF|nr:oligopeptide transporter 1-like [Syzygium oleosum]